MVIKPKTLKMLGLTATLIGYAAEAAGRWIENKNLESLVAEKVAEAVSKMTHK